MSNIFEGVNKFFGLGSGKSAPKAKSQAEQDDDIRFRNKFRDGPNDTTKSKKKKKNKTSAGKKLKKAASGGLAGKLRDKSKKAIGKN